MKSIEYRNVKLGLEREGDYWRLFIQDDTEVVTVILPDPVARAMATKITTGKTIEIADAMPVPTRLQ